MTGTRFCGDMAGQGTGMVLAPCHENPPASVVSLGFRSSPPGHGSNAYSGFENLGMNLFGGH